MDSVFKFILDENGFSPRAGKTSEEDMSVFINMYLVSFGARPATLFESNNYPTKKSDDYKTKFIELVTKLKRKYPALPIDFAYDPTSEYRVFMVNTESLGFPFDPTSKFNEYIKDNNEGFARILGYGDSLKEDHRFNVKFVVNMDDADGKNIIINLFNFRAGKPAPAFNKAYLKSINPVLRTIGLAATVEIEETVTTKVLADKIRDKDVPFLFKHKGELENLFWNLSMNLTVEIIEAIKTEAGLKTFLNRYYTFLYFNVLSSVISPVDVFVPFPKEKAVAYDDAMKKLESEFYASV